MTDKIKIITSPDLILDQTYSILAVAPSQELKKSIENFIVDKKKPLNLYFYFGNENDIKWLLTTAKIVDMVLIDLDNLDERLAKFSGYLMSFPYTYYKTSDEKVDWSILNANRFYDFPDIKGY